MEEHTEIQDEEEYHRVYQWYWDTLYDRSYTVQHGRIVAYKRMGEYERKRKEQECKHLPDCSTYK